MAYVKLYKDGKVMSIETNASDEGEFVRELAGVLEALVERGQHDGDWAFQFENWLPQAADIISRYRGYKADVREDRILIAGYSYPNGTTLIAHGDEKKVVIPEEQGDDFNHHSQE